MAVLLACLLLLALLPPPSGAAGACEASSAALQEEQQAVHDGHRLRPLDAHQAQICSLCPGCQQCQPLPATETGAVTPVPPWPVQLASRRMAEAPPDPAFRPPRA